MKHRIVVLIALMLATTGCVGNTTGNDTYTNTTYEYRFTYPAKYSANENTDTSVVKIQNGKTTVYTATIVEYGEPVTKEFLEKKYQTSVQSIGNLNRVTVEELNLSDRTAFRVTWRERNMVQDAPHYVDSYDQDIVIIPLGEQYLVFTSVFDTFNKEYKTNHDELTQIVNSFADIGAAE